MNVDLAAAVRLMADERAVERAAAWRRAEDDRAAFRAEKKQARTAGLKVRHALKIARQRQATD